MTLAMVKRTLSIKQRGAALILITFILTLGVAAYILKVANSAALESEANTKTYQALGEAKAALIAWAISHPNTPGQMPWPDRNGDGNYDGNSDCYATSLPYQYLIGQLPIVGQTNPCVTPQTGLGGDWRDAQGNRLWYSVSRNLVHDYQTGAPNPDPIINPGIINSPTYPWFKVRDRNGTVISDRVAAVIIAPGVPTEIQDRSGGIAGANQYLDKIIMADGTPYSNYGYPLNDLAVQEFIVGDDTKIVSASDTTYQHPYYFNDKLVYITIDELMEALEKRVGEVANSALKTYKATNGYYPFAAALGATTNINHCVVKNMQGWLPTAATPASHVCSCSGIRTSSTCSCNFAIASSSISFQRRGTATFAVASGACSRTNSNRTCTCTGAGYCGTTAAATTKFTCDACGSCSATFRGTYTISSNADFSSPTSSGGNTSCTLNTPNTSFSVTMDNTAAFGSGSASATMAACSATQTLNSALVSAYPWFTSNKWEQYVYYKTSPNCTQNSGSSCSAQLTVGSQAATVLSISSGKPITSSPFAIKGSPQTRTSCDMKDYLDSSENTDNDLVFDAKGTSRTTTYNDQMFYQTQ